MKLAVYCSGSIAKGAADRGKLTWTTAERMEVTKGAAPHEVVFLTPDDPITDPGNTLGQFGRDMYQVMVASAVIVDARERRGLGIGVEMAAAGGFGTPVIVVAPPESKYRAAVLEYRGAVVRDYVHPHVAALATAVVDDFAAAGAALAGLVATGPLPAKAAVPDWLAAAIGEYRDNVLAGDAPMLRALRELAAVPG
ncbi:hypothetical protein Sru01_34940 [Sphaerisporangium rufum]|uniref:Nucleoside 2-deoxyribosyltransferase n=1 Tax=Sphaerisporangium rufum TaxID=1381558 RepID=A0A919R2K6_9ACTN|nr:hypothetical protein [Sphaerisporangium rufum]GII78512.1 hypothetical protein Sru01_34940 [Sphaerisporangium rufum]